MIKRIIIGLVLFMVIAVFFFYTPDKSIAELKTMYTDQESKFLNVKGMDVHYKIEGMGMPLLLLHGTGSSLHTWDQWTKALVDSFQVIRVDLPAYGLTGPRPDRDYKTSSYISFLDEFMSRVGIDSFHIAGNSFGGGLAFVYAGMHPDKVGKLVLIDASGIPSKGERPIVFKLASNPIMSMVLQKVTPKSFIKKNLLEVYENDAQVTEELVTRYHDFAIREGNRQAFVDRVKTHSKDYSGLLKKLEEPTLIMWGEKDEWIPFEIAHEMDRLIPNSRIVSYPNVGHLPMEEFPKVSAEDARSFLLEKL